MKTKEQTQEIRKPDGQGRIVIGKEFRDETFSVEPQGNGDILLRPVVVMPKAEAWLMSNPVAAASVKRGIEQSIQGEVESLGDFTQFLEEDEKE